MGITEWAIALALASIVAGVISEYKRHIANKAMVNMVLMMAMKGGENETLKAEIAQLSKDVAMYKERSEILAMHKHDLERAAPEWEK